MIIPEAVLNGTASTTPFTDPASPQQRATAAAADGRASKAQAMIVIFKEASVAAATASELAATAAASARAAGGTAAATPSALDASSARSATRLRALASLKSSVLAKSAGAGGSRASSAAAKHISADDTLDHLPLSVVSVTSPRALRKLRANKHVAAVVPNELHQRLMKDSLPLIEQPAAALAGYTGAGCSVAVLDTGANFKSKDLGACTAVGQPAATCRLKFMRDFTTKAGVPYDDGSLDDHNHGTNVASTVARVAPGADILALDVFFPEGAYLSDILAAINW